MELKDTPENLELVNIYMRYDILRVFDYETILAWLNNIVQLEAAAYFHYPKTIKEFNKVRTNLQKVVKEFFEWDYERFWDPMDQYLFIAENHKKIFDNIFKNVELTDESAFIKFNARTSVKIERLAKNIVEYGLKHGFKPINQPNDHFINKIQ